MPTVNVCDFIHSLVTFRIDLLRKAPRTVSRKPPFTLNDTRLQLECRCWITTPGTSDGGPALYVLSASCKAEQVMASPHVRAVKITSPSAPSSTPPPTARDPSSTSLYL
jgi:hypothetical protein